MQRCPKCGYREMDWPAILMVLAFSTLYTVFIMAMDHAPRGLRLIGLLTFFIFLAAITWKAIGDENHRRNYLMTHPPKPRVGQ